MKELAIKIDEYLKKFESDPDINKRDKHSLLPYYNSRAYYSGGHRINITYVSYQGFSTITKKEAIEYLGWLLNGNVGKHWEALRESK